MAHVIWSDRALERLEEIADDIARYAPGAASGLVRRIFRAGEQLEDFPLSGRVVPEFEDQNLRELIVGNYRVLYRVAGGAVTITTVQHGAKPLSRADME